MILNLTITYIPFFFFNDTATTEIYTLSLHDALPILFRETRRADPRPSRRRPPARAPAASRRCLSRGPPRGGSRTRRSRPWHSRRAAGGAPRRLVGARRNRSARRLRARSSAPCSGGPRSVRGRPPRPRCLRRAEIGRAHV